MRTKNYAFLFSCFFFVLMLGETASSIGIAPAILQIENAQGFEATYNFYVRAGTRPDIYVNVACKDIPELEKYITTDFNGLPFTPGELRYFTVYVNIPSNFTIPGRHLCMIQAEEVSEEGGSGMTAYSAVGAQIYLRIPYPEKYIDVSLQAPDVNKSMPVPFTINLISRGLEDVLAYGTITIKDSDDKDVAKVYTQQIVVESLQSGVLNTEWDSSGQPAGIYNAFAEIEYDGDAPAVTNKVFRIGEVSIEITNVSYPEVIEPDKIVKLDVSVQSMWNERIDGAYIELQSFRDGAATGRTSRSESFDMNRWESKDIPIYWDTDGFAEGEYDLKFLVHYNGKESGKSVKVEIRRAQNLLLIIVILAILIAVAAALYLLRKKRKKRSVMRL